MQAEGLGLLAAMPKVTEARKSVVIVVKCMMASVRLVSACADRIKNLVGRKQVICGRQDLKRRFRRLESLYSSSRYRGPGRIHFAKRQ